MLLPHTIFASTRNLDTAPKLTVTAVTDSRINFSYANLPKGAYVNLLWKNIKGQFESDGQVILKKGGKGKSSIAIDKITPSGTHKLQGLSQDSMTWSIDSSEFAIGDTSSPELNCVLSILPPAVKRTGTVTINWKSLGANYLLWKQNNAADVFDLTTEKLLGDGSVTFRIPSGAKAGMMDVVMQMYRDDGTQGTCSGKVRIK